MELVAILNYTIFFGIPIVLALALAMTFGWSLNKPLILIYPLLAILIFFAGTQWGQVSATFNIYGFGGGGRILFPAIILYLFGTAFSIWLGVVFRGTVFLRNNLSVYLWLLLLLVVVHVFAAPVFGKEIREATTPTGLITLAYLAIMFFVLVNAVRNKESLIYLQNFILIMVFLRGLYGIGRLIFFDGDPQNPYQNYELINVKLTFYDFGDGMLASMAAFYAAWRVFIDRQEVRGKVRFFYFVVMMVELSVIALSYRRASWFGLVLAAMMLMYFFNRRQKIFASLVIIPVTLTSFVLLSVNRFTASTAQSGLLDRLFPDFVSSSGGLSRSSGRLEDIFLALEVIKENFLLGIGAWGHYRGSGLSSLTGNDYAYVHSTFLHILLKSGVVGIGLVLMLFAMYFSFAIKTRSTIEPKFRAFYWSGVAGIVFQIPFFMIDTLITQIRPMLLIALALAIPYLVYAAQKMAPTRST